MSNLSSTSKPRIGEAEGISAAVRPRHHSTILHPDGTERLHLAICWYNATGIDAGDFAHDCAGADASGGVNGHVGVESNTCLMFPVARLLRRLPDV